MLENSCMRDEVPPLPINRGGGDGGGLRGVNGG